MVVIQLLSWFMLAAGPFFLPAHPSEPVVLTGKWSVVSYSEQGVPVSKSADPLTEARRVYAQVQATRSLNFYGWVDPGNRREQQAFQEWLSADSVREVTRLRQIIPLPYFVVFFPDSTLSTYNIDAATGTTTHTETWRYSYHESFSSFDYATPYERKNAQILSLTATRLTLFLPEEAEIVELVREAYRFP